MSAVRSDELSRSGIDFQYIKIRITMRILRRNITPKHGTSINFLDYRVVFPPFVLSFTVNTTRSASKNDNRKR
jgi:hypothetical protein